MPEAVNAQIAALGHLRRSLFKHKKNTTPPSELLLAQVEDTCLGAVAGDRTRSVVEEIFNRSRQEDEPVEINKLIELTGGALATLKQQAVDSIAQPGIASQDPYFQGLVSHALFANPTVKRFLAVLVLAYAVAAGLLLYPIHQAFDNAGLAGEILEAAKAEVKESNLQLVKATQARQDIDASIDGFHRGNAALAAELDQLKADIETVYIFLQGAQNKFQVSIDSLKLQLEQETENASAEIMAIPEEERKKLQPTITTMTSDVDGQLKTVQGYQLTLTDLSTKLDSLNTQLTTHEKNLNTTIGSRLDALFEGQDQVVAAQVKQKTSEIAKTDVDDLNRKLAKLETTIANLEADVAVRSTELTAVDNSIESTRLDIEKRESDIKSKLGAYELTAQQLTKQQGRVDDLERDIEDANKLVKVIETLLDKKPAISDIELAEQLWLTIRENYVLVLLTVLVGVSFFWLLVLSLKCRKLRSDLPSSQAPAAAKTPAAHE
jgi:hypothetical protein